MYRRLATSPLAYWAVLFVFLGGCSRVSQQHDQENAASPPPPAQGSVGLGESGILCNPNAALRFLTIKEIQDELALAPEKRVALDSLAQESKNGEQGDLQEKIQAILGIGKIERLNQICLQLEWPNLLAHPKVQKLLGFTNEQEKMLLHVREEEVKRVQDLLASTKPEDRYKRKRDLLKETRTKKLDVLTPAQKELLEQMKGNKLKVDISKING